MELVGGHGIEAYKLTQAQDITGGDDDAKEILGGKPDVTEDDAKPPKDGSHQGEGDEATVNMLKFVDTGQEYLESRHQFNNSKVVDNTGHQIRMYENTLTDSEMFNEAAFVGWCTNYRGTNADSDVSTNGTRVDQNVMEYEKPHQLGSHHGHLGADRGHPQRDGYWVRQQADHTHHRDDPHWDKGGQQEIPGGHDHRAEPPGRAH